MGRTIKSLARKRPLYRAQPRVLVLCEDTKSSKCYLEDASVYFRASAEVDIAHCGVTHPSGIVKEGVSRSKKYDHVYCVIDRDTHNCFDQALLMAKGCKNLTVIPSYPCFEFWLILHFGHCRKPFNGTQRLSAGDEAVAALRGYPGMNGYNKNSKISTFQMLQGAQFELARRISPAVLEQAKAEGNLNPSTEIHVLIDVFEALSAPQKVES